MTDAVRSVRRLRPYVGAMIAIVGLYLMVAWAKEESKKQSEKREAQMQHLQSQEFEGVLNGLNSGHQDTLRMTWDTYDHVDDKLKRVSMIPSVRQILLEITDVTDRGVSYIAALPNLETLALMGAHVTDQGIEHLRGKERLKNLVLQSTVTTDAAISVVGTMPNLTYFCFYCEDPNIKPDFGRRVVTAIKELRQLKELTVGGNWLTDDMMTEIKQALPNVKVRKLNRGEGTRYQIAQKTIVPQRLTVQVSASRA